MNRIQQIKIQQRKTKEQAEGKTFEVGIFSDKKAEEKKAMNEAKKEKEDRIDQNKCHCVIL